jgi:hypothetical protein
VPNGGDDSPFFSKSPASLVLADNSDPEEGQIEAEKIVAQRDQTIFDQVMGESKTQEIHSKQEVFSFH